MHPGPHLALIYDYVDNAVHRRVPYRDAHLAHINAAKDAGLLVAAGALGEPPHGGLLVFAGEDRAAVERFATDDPYLANKIVTAWRVEPWSVLVAEGDEG